MCLLQVLKLMIMQLGVPLMTIKRKDILICIF